MTRTDLLAFLRSHRYAVQASVAPVTGVQAAVVGIAVADNFDIVFDTIETSRKARNLVRDPRIALVIGGTLDGEERTVQYEGLAERLRSADKRVVEELYFRIFPEGRDRLSWEGIMHVRVRARWLRYSDFRTARPTVVEFDAAALAALR
ncbi:MAG: pyridoxamine 5'-phosphate oxidase family protein [Gemmatimonadetes bacterium]|nr:pyridoxamine 5'-phosphate oxidase family protein [Gemmatimonadota bacterium]